VIRVALIAALLCVPMLAKADTYIFAGGAFTRIADGGAPADIPVPNVVGEANFAAADAILEGDGLDLGAVTERCSAAADDEVVGQDPAPGAIVNLGSLVNVLVSNGVECVSSGGVGVRLRGLRMRGL